LGNQGNIYSSSLSMLINVLINVLINILILLTLTLNPYRFLCSFNLSIV
jgi:hypothetical protein